MNSWTRRLALIVSGSALRFILFFGVGLVCIILVFGTRDSITQSIKDTRASERFVDALVAETIKANQNSSIPLEDPKIQQIIKDSFTPELMTKSSQAIIDGAYDWLEGNEPSIKFTVDFTEARQNLANGIATYAFDRLQAQPTCFAVPEQVDPFTAGCLPPFSDITAEKQKLAGTIAGPDGFMKQAVFTEADLPKNTEGKTIEQQFAYVPRLYSYLKYLPYVLPVFLIALSACIVLLAPNKRKGFQQLDLALIGSGIALLITPVLFMYVLPRFSSATEFSVGNSPTQQVFNDVANNLTSDLYGLIINISIQVVVLGLLIMMVERFTRPRSLYLGIERKSGLISSNTKKPSSNRKLKPGTVPIQSSEESVRRKPRRTKNKKYRKIPKKEI